MRVYLFFLVLLVFASCHDTTEYNVRRTIVNESQVPIRVAAYSQGEVIEEFSVLPGEGNIKDEICVDERGRLDCDQLTGQDIQWDLFSDSVVVFFNEERIESFCGFISDCTLQDRNLLLFPIHLENEEHATGYVKTLEGDTQVFTFTISNEDFDNADPIGG